MPYFFLTSCFQMPLRVFTLLILVNFIYACSSSGPGSNDDVEMDELAIYSIDNYQRPVDNNSLTGLWVGTGEYSTVTPAPWGGIWNYSDITERRIFSVADSDDGYQFYETQQFLGAFNPSTAPILGDAIQSESINHGTLFRNPISLVELPPYINHESLSLEILSNEAMKLTKALSDSYSVQYNLRKIANQPVDIELPETSIGKIKFIVERTLDGQTIETRTFSTPVYSIINQHRIDTYPNSGPITDTVDVSLIYFDGRELGPYLIVDAILYPLLEVTPIGTSVLQVAKHYQDNKETVRINGALDGNPKIPVYSITPYNIEISVQYQSRHPIYYSWSDDLIPQLAMILGFDPSALRYVDNIRATINIDF